MRNDIDRYLFQHDWILFEPSIPWLKNNKGKGPDTAADWGINHVADFLQKFAESTKSNAKSSKRENYRSEAIVDRF